MCSWFDQKCWETARKIRRNADLSKSDVAPKLAQEAQPRLADAAGVALLVNGALVALV
jgi:hypothetical protein